MNWMVFETLLLAQEAESLLTLRGRALLAASGYHLAQEDPEYSQTTILKTRWARPRQLNDGKAVIPHPYIASGATTETVAALLTQPFPIFTVEPFDPCWFK